MAQENIIKNITTESLPGILAAIDSVFARKDNIEDCYDVFINLPGDDAAREILGGDWRIPTKLEWQELFENTTSSWETINDVSGKRFTASNGNSIFLPAAGEKYGPDFEYPDGYRQKIGTAGHYQTSSNWNQYYICLAQVYAGSNSYETLSYHYYGFSIRPVSNIEGVDLGLPSGIKWAETNLSDSGLVENETDLGDYYAWGEIKTKEKFFDSNYIGCKYRTPGNIKPVVTIKGKVYYNSKEKSIEILGEDGNTYKSENLKEYIAEKIAEAQLGGEGGSVDLSIYVKNSELETTLNSYSTKNEVNALEANKVNKVEGKGLSSNDFTDELKEKLENINITSTENISYYTGTDAAYANLGKNWKIPSDSDFSELKENTIKTQVTINGVGGFKYTSKTNSSVYIFLPNSILAGDAENNSTHCYMTSTSISNMYFKVRDSALNMTSLGKKYFGYHIRPVSTVNGVDLGLPSGTKWASCNLGSEQEYGIGGYYAWGEINEKNIYADYNYKFAEISSTGEIDFKSSNIETGSSNSVEKIVIDDSFNICGVKSIENETELYIPLKTNSYSKVSYTGSYDDLINKPNLDGFVSEEYVNQKIEEVQNTLTDNVLNTDDVDNIINNIFI